VLLWLCIGLCVCMKWSIYTHQPPRSKPPPIPRKKLQHGVWKQVVEESSGDTYYWNAGVFICVIEFLRVFFLSIAWWSLSPISVMGYSLPFSVDSPLLVLMFWLYLLVILFSSYIKYKHKCLCLLDEKKMNTKRQSQTITKRQEGFTENPRKLPMIATGYNFMCACLMHLCFYICMIHIYIYIYIYMHIHIIHLLRTQKRTRPHGAFYQ